MLECIERETAPHPTHSVIWLHGLGADGNDFVPILPQLLRREWPPLRFVFPHARIRPVTVNNGLPMRAWYDIAGFDLAQRQDAAGVRASVAEVEKLIAREAGRGVPAGKVVLAGFSQGGAIALATALQHAEPLAGTIGLSTYLPLQDAMAQDRRKENAGTPIFMAHGNFDPVVPMRLGETSCQLLRGFGHQVEWHSYPMAHQVCPQEIVDLADWLSERVFAMP